MKTTAKTKYRPVIYLTLIMIILSNTPPAAWLLQPAYHYRTKDNAFSFQEIPGKGMDWGVLQIRYERYLDRHPNAPEKQLYRTFTIKPWQFWQWWEMIVRNDRFLLPYLDR